MRARATPTIGLALLWVGGCVSGPDAGRPAADRPGGPVVAGARGGQRPRPGVPWQAAAKPARPWEWVTAVPQGATRAEVVAPVVAGPQLAALLPGWADRGVKLASAGSGPPGGRITAVNGKTVADCNQLNAAAVRAASAGELVTVRLAGGPPGGVALKPAQLAALCQVTAPGKRLLRVTEGGNSWVLVRQGGVRCKVMARVEREHGLLQVAVAPAVCWGTQALLPREVRAWCDGRGLRCLSVAGTLEALYGGKGPQGGSSAEDSFAAVSERADYLLPANYKRLQQAVQAGAGRGGGPAGPALATLPGVAYPGPAVLGDARALAAFLQQRQLYQPGEPERAGWIFFSGEVLRGGTALDLEIDLGRGPTRLAFVLPGA